jgi:hypothetical protein
MKTLHCFALAALTAFTLATVSPARAHEGPEHEIEELTRSNTT